MDEIIDIKFLEAYRSLLKMKLFKDAGYTCKEWAEIDEHKYDANLQAIWDDLKAGDGD